ncbi:MAG: imidazolonepropionase [Deltaproteobacteria bacterium]|nr:imidazolonepropionase [Deltaproteobacteria bacterium]
MELSVVDAGSAVELNGAYLRLKDLLGLGDRSLGSASIRRAEWRDPNWIELGLSDGRRVLASSEPASVTRVVRTRGQILTMGAAGELGIRSGGAIVLNGARIDRICDVDEVLPAELANAEEIDLGDRLVTPGLIDPHTHLLFLGQRAEEFGMKAAGKSYLEIHRAGGGILSTVRATRAGSLEALSQAAIANARRLLAAGVTSCEAKSGYALELKGELRMLEALRIADNSQPVDIQRTLLAAHTVPEEFAEASDDYLALICEQLIPAAVATPGLLSACDAYLEQGAFDLQQVRRVFEAARRHRLDLHLHAGQFSDLGGAQLAAEMNALSVDHLEFVSAEGIAALAKTGTTAILLPGAALTCRCPAPPVAELVAAGVPIALGTDFNPGSSMTASLPLMMSLACTMFGLSCELAWRAVTVNAARAIGRPELGRIVAGAPADLVAFDAADYREVPYFLGANLVAAVVKSGQVVIGAQR